MEFFISLIWKVFVFWFDRRLHIRRRHMSKKSPELRSEYLNYLRFTLDESGANTFKVELDTNLSAERGVMMEIHSVEFEMPDDILLREVAAGASEQILCQVTRETKTAIVFVNDSDVIAKVNHEIARSATIGTDAGPLYFMTDSIQRIEFPLPIPYVKPSIFIGLQGTIATAIRVRGRIGYTIRDIDREDFLELLVALQ